MQCGDSQVAEHSALTATSVCAKGEIEIDGIYLI